MSGNGKNSNNKHTQTTLTEMNRICLILGVEQRDHIVRKFMHIECTAVVRHLGFLCVICRVRHVCMYVAINDSSHNKIGKRQIRLKAQELKTHIVRI